MMASMDVKYVAIFSVTIVAMNNFAANYVLDFMTTMKITRILYVIFLVPDL
jgi:hypothetical protein